MSVSKMELVLFIAISCVLASDTYAQQGCPTITESDLGSIDAPSMTGLIAERLEDVVQLVEYRVVCEATAGSRDLYNEVSVVAEYMFGDPPSTMSAQFEFSCVANGGGVQWDTTSRLSFTTPPDITDLRFAITRRDCYTCVSPNLHNSSAPASNHCLRCTNCMGLNQCTSQSPTDCCNYYDRDGSCTLSCTPPFVPLTDNNCGCPQGMVELPGNTCGCPQGMVELPDNTCGCPQGMVELPDNTCGCPPGFTGTACETSLDPCNPIPCVNGGTCLPLDSSSYECDCPMGFEGDMCQNNIDECVASPSPCLNGATCRDMPGSYTCDCQGNWEEADCGRCGITNCTTCSNDGSACDGCIDGYFFNPENALVCTVIPGPAVARCTLAFCDLCSPDNLICDQCESGYIVGLNSLCVRGTPREINLTDIEIIAIIVGCTIGAILIVVLVLCCLVWTCRSVWKRGPNYIRTKRVVKKRIHKKKKQTTSQTGMVNADAEMDAEMGADEAKGGDLTLF